MEYATQVDQYIQSRKSALTFVNKKQRWEALIESLPRGWGVVKGPLVR